jgi:hypothetical protein
VTECHNAMGTLAFHDLKDIYGMDEQALGYSMSAIMSLYSTAIVNGLFFRTRCILPRGWLIPRVILFLMGDGVTKCGHRRSRTPSVTAMLHNGGMYEFLGLAFALEVRFSMFFSTTITG